MTGVIVCALAAPIGGSDARAAMRALLATAAVLGVLLLIAWLARRGTLAWPGRRASSAITIETAVPLGERRSLVIVTVEGRRLLLGMTPVHVGLVTDLGPAASAPFSRALDEHVQAERAS